MSIIQCLFDLLIMLGLDFLYASKRNHRVKPYAFGAFSFWLRYVLPNGRPSYSCRG